MCYSFCESPEWLTPLSCPKLTPQTLAPQHGLAAYFTKSPFDSFLLKKSLFLPPLLPSGGKGCPSSLPWAPPPHLLIFSIFSLCQLLPLSLESDYVILLFAQVLFLQSSFFFLSKHVGRGTGFSTASPHSPCLSLMPWLSSSSHKAQE